MTSRPTSLAWPACLAMVVLCSPVPGRAEGPAPKPGLRRAAAELVGSSWHRLTAARRASAGLDEGALPLARERLHQARLGLARSLHRSPVGRVATGVAQGAHELWLAVKEHPVKSTLICAGLCGACVLGDALGLPASPMLLWGSLGWNALKAAKTAAKLPEVPRPQRLEALGHEVVWPSLMIGASLAGMSELPAPAKIVLNLADDLVPLQALLTHQRRRLSSR